MPRYFRWFDECAQVENIVSNWKSVHDPKCIDEIPHRIFPEVRPKKYHKNRKRDQVYKQREQPLVQIIEYPVCLHFIDNRYKNGKEGDKHTRDSLIHHEGGGQRK